MKIVIDGKIVDFTLENEKNIGEVISALEVWLSSGGLKISGIALDGKEAALSQFADIFKTQISEIGELSITSSADAEIALEAITKAQGFLSAAGGTEKDKKDSIKIEWEKSYAAAFLQKREAEIFKKVNEAFLGGEEPDLKTLIEERRRELQNPIGEFLSLEENVKAVSEGLENYALDIQMGRNKKAAESIMRFSAVDSKIFRIIPLLRFYGIKLEELQLEDGFFDNFNAALKEFFEAYEDADTVLSGDLAEYEIAPRISGLYNAVKQKCAELKS